LILELRSERGKRLPAAGGGGRATENRELRSNAVVRPPSPVPRRRLSLRIATSIVLRIEATTRTTCTEDALP